MNIPVALISAIETALNAWLKLDGESLEKCEPLEGKIIRLDITDINVNLYFLPAVSGIQVMGNYPLEDPNSDKPKGEIDATIHGSSMALMKLGTAEDSGATLLENDITIDGDMRVAEAFSTILREVDIDWEELFSKMVGDIFAHQAGNVVRETSDWFKQTAEAFRLNTGEYLSEESKVTPAEAEIESYTDEVDDIRMDVDRLTARIKQLQEKLNESSKKDK